MTEMFRTDYISRPTPPTCKTRNWPRYNEALKRRGSLAIWFDPGMIRDAAPSGKRGWRQSRSDAANQTCLTTKVLFGMALRQTTGFVESLLRLIGLDWRVPDFSTLCRRRKTLAVNIFVSRLEGSAAPLDRQYRYQDGPKRRVWHKTHPGTDEETLEVRAVEVRTA